MIKQLGVVNMAMKSANNQATKQRWNENGKRIVCLSLVFKIINCNRND